ncbi:MAG: glutamine--fructose-6-phosphate transaminase (isomerizing) [Bacteroidetes bacterium]|nr:glutamine--fructose-6-phosphate transaminase (isomerizing) [Bacteroidota bacterium]
MCGIVGYVGYREAIPVIIKGLKRLEYRGYDSAGVAVLNGALQVCKKAGKVAELETELAGRNLHGTMGMGHTRWATHGLPNDTNAHPHVSSSTNLAIIHNGIIENYAALRAELEGRGHRFISDTDTEVLINLIEDIQQKEGLDLEKALPIALSQVIGAYAIVIISQDEPNRLYAARKSSPLVIGLGKGEFFLASDATPIIEYTRNVVYLNDEEVAVVNRNGEMSIRTIDNKRITPYVQELQMKLETIEKGGYEHFMLKEIYEQPRSITDSLRGRIGLGDQSIHLRGIQEFEAKFVAARRIIVVACGTSWHAGLVAEYLFEDYARIPVEVEYASEFRYRNPILDEHDIVIAISQSGETADTLAAIELAKSRGATIYGICNVVGSSISRATDAGSYTHAGPEIGVASTKAFTAQITIVTLMALAIARAKGTISESRYHFILDELQRIPAQIEMLLQSDSLIRDIAEEFVDVRNFLYLGRGYNFPVALEGALKLKEISYIHAEGYPAAEMKHGPIALIDEHMPVVVLATNPSAYDKIVSNIQEVKARKGRIIAIVAEDDKVIRQLADFTVVIPKTEESLTPLLSVVPLQLLAYHIAVMRGCNVDQPRNLAKSVTVE